VFTASDHVPAARLPAAGMSSFVDESFTRPPPPAPEVSWMARARNLARGRR
jgi:hypothetical protein